MNPDTTLAALADGPFTDVDLAELSLRLAVDEYPTLDVAKYLRRLDSLTIEVAPRHPPVAWRAGIRAARSSRGGVSGRTFSHRRRRNGRSNTKKNGMANAMLAATPPTTAAAMEAASPGVPRSGASRSSTGM